MSYPAQAEGLGKYDDNQECLCMNSAVFDGTQDCADATSSMLTRSGSVQHFLFSLNRKLIPFGKI